LNCEFIPAASALIGYGVLNQSFFENDFAPLIVKVSARRHGVATAIMTALESQCAGKLFQRRTHLHRLLPQAVLVALLTNLGAFIAPTHAQAPSTKKVQSGDGHPYEIAGSELWDVRSRF
jgi:hypothetical protein